MFTTPVKIEADPTLSYQSRILMLGSCFVQNMGEQMLAAKMNVCVNPFGITYNPLSIANILGRLLENRFYTEQELAEYDGKWFSWGHHGVFSSADKSEALSRINTAYAAGVDMLAGATHLVVTFGSSYVYKYGGRVVNNCHKLPGKCFEERQLTVAEIVAAWQTLLTAIYAANSSLQIIFTVSPVRYLGRGAHASQLNKSTLLMAIDQLQREYPQAGYFPSYEILLDELRDYRYYADDMIHPSSLAVRYIWQRFCDCYLTAEGQKTMDEVEHVVKALNHRPFTLIAKHTGVLWRRPPMRSRSCGCAIRIYRSKRLIPVYNECYEVFVLHIVSAPFCRLWQNR